MSRAVKEYVKKFNQLKVGDKVYSAHSTYNYPEDVERGLPKVAGRRTTEYTITGKRVETNEITDSSGKTKRERKVYYSAEGFERSGGYYGSFNTTSCEFEVSDFDGTHDYFFEDNWAFANSNWWSFHKKDCDAISINFWDCLNRARNIESRRDEYNELLKQKREIEKKLKEIENEH